MWAVFHRNSQIKNAPPQYWVNIGSSGALQALHFQRISYVSNLEGKILHKHQQKKSETKTDNS